MIEVYIDNHDNPEHVENTVKEFSEAIEHADDITCVTICEERMGAFEALDLKILFKRASDGRPELGIKRRL